MLPRVQIPSYLSTDSGAESAAASWPDLHLVANDGFYLETHRILLASISPFLHKILSEIPEQDAEFSSLITDLNQEELSMIVRFAVSGLAPDYHQSPAVQDVFQCLGINFREFQFEAVSRSELQQQPLLSFGGCGCPSAISCEVIKKSAIPRPPPKKVTTLTNRRI